MDVQERCHSKHTLSSELPSRDTIMRFDTLKGSGPVGREVPVADKLRRIADHPKSLRLMTQL